MTKHIKTDLKKYHNSTKISLARYEMQFLFNFLIVYGFALAKAFLKCRIFLVFVCLVEAGTGSSWRSRLAMTCRAQRSYPVISLLSSPRNRFTGQTITQAKRWSRTSWSSGLSAYHSLLHPSLPSAFHWLSHTVVIYE